MTRQDTYDALQKWVDELLDNNNGNMVPCIVIGNKADLREDIVVESEKAEELVKRLSDKYNTEFRFVEASAKTGENVKHSFEMLIRKIFDDFSSRMD